MKHIFIRGNSKLGKDVLVFNLPPGGKAKGGTCRPTAWCAKHCYAMKGLHLFPSVQKSNLNHLTASLTKTFVDDAIAELKRTSKPYVRIHSSGDFYSKEYVEKWVKICKAMPDKKFLAYTKRMDLLEPLKKLARLPNVSLYESLDDSKAAAKSHFLRAMIDGTPIASKRAASKRSRDTIKCPGECTSCGYLCWDRDKHVIFEQH
jgi:hypothetical protein